MSLLLPLVILGGYDEARPEFERAAALMCNAHERELLIERVQACNGGSGAAASG
jgi:predicted RNA polymerase sigma factor